MLRRKTNFKTRKESLYTLENIVNNLEKETLVSENAIYIVK